MDKIIEKYKLYIGFFLIFAIILGGVVLLWQKDILNDLSQKLKSTEQVELENYQKENQDLRKEITKLEGKISQIESEKEVLGAQTDASGEKININTADAVELDKLPGVGPARAQSIIDYRQKTGGFKTIEEIQNIKGIGPATFAKMANMIIVE